MSSILSERFQFVLRNSTTPIVVVAEFYSSNHTLKHYKVYSIYPFELVTFLSEFNKSSYSSVTFVAYLPSKLSNEFSPYHIVTL